MNPDILCLVLNSGIASFLYDLAFMYRIIKIDPVKELVYVADEPKGKSFEFYFPKLSDAVFIEEYTLKLISSDGRYKMISLLGR